MSRLLLQFSNLYKSFGPNQLFDDIALSINQGEIFALVGENGAGKTTLLKLLLGSELPDSGHLSKAAHLNVGLLPQEISLKSPEINTRAYIETGPLSILEMQMKSCLDDPNRLTEWAELHEKYEHLGGYRQLPSEKILSGLKLDLSLLDIPMTYLSSGQRVRVALAKALIQNSELLLLDEPTNHLDQEMIDWLKITLQKREGATIIVSHDRAFLNATCNRLMEIKKHKLICYSGSYDFYLEEQKRILEKEMRAYEDQQEERGLLKQKIKALTFSKGKAAAPKDNNIMAYDCRGENHQKSLQHHLTVLKAKLADIEAHAIPHPKPKTITGLKFPSTPSLTTSTVIELQNITKSFDGKVLFHDFNKTVSKNDRIILTGPNGKGKSSLLRCIMGFLPLDGGKIIYASSTKIGYLDQEVALLPLEETALYYFESRFNLKEQDLRSEIHKAAIGKADLLDRPFSTLSTGQRKRLMILSIILEKPNVLLLDEPTNHLDFLTLEALENALIEFEGAILAVSHDQTFINKIATDVWEL